ncbi:hypothetical protein D3C75_1242500 [compost metagenome]
MNEGYFIGQGDKTTCGGKVLDGDGKVNMFGLQHAREGDRVSCGKDGNTYQIRAVSGTWSAMAGIWPAPWIATVPAPAKRD